MSNAAAKYRRYTRNYDRARRARFFALGLCTRCGKLPHAEGRKSCEECLKFLNIKNSARCRPGFCSRCRKNPAEPHHLCEPCIKALRATNLNWNRHHRRIAKASERLVIVSEYLTKDLSAQDMLRVREQEKIALRSVFSAVRAMWDRKKAA